MYETCIILNIHFPYDYSKSISYCYKQFLVSIFIKSDAFLFSAQQNQYQIYNHRSIKGTAHTKDHYNIITGMETLFSNTSINRQDTSEKPIDKATLHKI